MSVFTVNLPNQPGELARLCEAMAGAGVNLASFSLDAYARAARPASASRHPASTFAAPEAPSGRATL